MAKYKNRDVTVLEVTPDVEYANTVTVTHADGSKETVKKSEVMVSLAEAARLRNATLGGSDPMLLPPEERPGIPGPTIAEVSAKEAADAKVAADKKSVDAKKAAEVHKFPFLKVK
jgi:hypothetical protein